MTTEKLLVILSALIFFITTSCNRTTPKAEKSFSEKTSTKNSLNEITSQDNSEDSRDAMQVLEDWYNSIPEEVKIESRKNNLKNRFNNFGSRNDNVDIYHIIREWNGNENLIGWVVSLPEYDKLYINWSKKQIFVDDKEKGYYRLLYEFGRMHEVILPDDKRASTCSCTPKKHSDILAAKELDLSCDLIFYKDAREKDCVLIMRLDFGYLYTKLGINAIEKNISF